MAIAINRFTDGKSAEICTNFDMVSLCSQIGVLGSASTASEDERALREMNQTRYVWTHLV